MFPEYLLGPIIGMGLSNFLQRFRFPAQASEESRVTTENVVRAFRAGITAACGRKRLNITTEAFYIPWNWREFFWEGAATGLAALHSFTFHRGVPDRLRLTNESREMHYTGYGFWEGLTRCYPLPTFTLREEIWSLVPDFPKYGPLMGGGIGFAVVAVARKFDESVLRQLSVPKLHGWEFAVLHGCGRALWFVYMHNQNCISSIVDSYPEYSERLLEGIGIAIAYTQMDNPRRILECINGFQKACHRRMVIRGMAVALVQIAEQHPEAISIIRCGGPDLYQPYEMCKIAVSTVPVDASWYATYVGAVRGLWRSENI